MRRAVRLTTLAVGTADSAAPLSRVVLVRRGYAEEASAFSGPKAENLGNGKYRFKIEVSPIFLQDEGVS